MTLNLVYHGENISIHVGEADLNSPHRICVAELRFTGWTPMDDQHQRDWLDVPYTQGAESCTVDVFLHLDEAESEFLAKHAYMREYLTEPMHVEEVRLIFSTYEAIVDLATKKIRKHTIHKEWWKRV